MPRTSRVPLPQRQWQPILIVILMLGAVSLFASHALAQSSAVSPAAPASDAAVPPVPSAGGSAAAPLPEFVPTDEWQTVLPGQAVPPGLWVRMDMTSGERTARLLPEEERRKASAGGVASTQQLGDGEVVAVEDSHFQDEQHQLAIVPETAEPSPSGSSGPSMRELPRPGQGAVPDAAVGAEPLASDADLLAARRARMAALRETFFLKEDVEQMKTLLAACIDPHASVGDVLQALALLEEYVHQGDNANDWATIGGIDVALTLLQQRVDDGDDTAQKVVEAAVPATPSQQEADVLISTEQLNETAAAADAPPAPLDLQAMRLYQLQASAAWVLGTAAQNNRRVQDAARRQKALPVLADLLQRTLQEEMAPGQDAISQSANGVSGDVAVVSAFQLRSARLKLINKVLYALSALLRHNARSQATFHQTAGADDVAVLRIRFDSESWARCEAEPVAAADGSFASPLSCISSVEERVLRRLRQTAQAKALSLAYDLVVDHTVNAATAKPAAAAAEQSQEAAAAPGSDAGASAPSAQPVVTAAEMSDPALFGALTSSPWCAHWLESIGGAASSPYDGSAVATHALDSLSALLAFDAGACRDALQGVGATAMRALQDAVSFHQAAAQRLAAAEDADGSAADVTRHTELAVTAGRLARLVQG